MQIKWGFKEWHDPSIQDNGIGSIQFIGDCLWKLNDTLENGLNYLVLAKRELHGLDLSLLKLSDMSISL